MNNAILIIWMSMRAMTSQYVPADQCQFLASQAVQEGGFTEAAIHAKCIYLKKEGAPHAQ